MHQGELSAGFLFSFANGNRSACQLCTGGWTLAASPALPRCVPGFGLRCTRPTPHKFLAICKPSKPQLCWGYTPLQAGGSFSSSITHTQCSKADGMASCIPGRSNPGGLACPCCSSTTYITEIVSSVHYKGVRNVLKTPGLGMVICQLGTLIYVY